MVEIAHISDVHLAPLPPVKPGMLLNKRITGYLNWRLNRQAHLQTDTLNRLIAHMKETNPDFIAVTGDMVNLSLDAEMERAGEWMRCLGPAERVCVIPGNHDAYVRGARAKFCAAMGPYCEGDLVDGAQFPFVRRIGEVAIVGCNSGVATPPFFASGRFGEAQAERLKRILIELGQKNFYRIVLIHHPPNAELASDPRRGLRGASRFRRVIAEAGAELVLHGHLHRSVINEIEGPEGGVPVVGVAAASAEAEAGHDPARYNLFSITRTSNGGWMCDLREYGYQRIGEQIVLRLQMRIT